MFYELTNLNKWCYTQWNEDINILDLVGAVIVELSSSRRRLAGFLIRLEITLMTLLLECYAL